MHVSIKHSNFYNSRILQFPVTIDSNLLLIGGILHQSLDHFLHLLHYSLVHLGHTNGCGENHISTDHDF